MTPAVTLGFKEFSFTRSTNEMEPKQRASTCQRGTNNSFGDGLKDLLRVSRQKNKICEINSEMT